MVQGVFFDLGGTLFSYSSASAGAVLMEAVRRLGVEAEPRDIGRAYMQASRDANAEFADRSYYLHKDLFEGIFQKFVDGLGVAYNPADFEWYEARNRDTIVESLQLKDDCLNTLHALRKQKLYLSIVSNIDDDMLNPLVAREGLHRWLSHWTSSEEAQSCKPDRRFFDLALEKSGLTPEQVLFVGDSPEHDVQGAFEVGMKTVLITPPDTKPPLQVGRETVAPDFEIARLSELVDIAPGLRAS